MSAKPKRPWWEPPQKRSAASSAPPTRAERAPEKRPRLIRIVENLPYNANGKLVRSKVAAMFSEEG